MKASRLSLGLLLALSLAACEGQKNSLDVPAAEGDGLFTLSDVAKILSDLPLEGEHLAEVHDAVSASSGNGYDEEYLLSDLFSAPGAGVGDNGAPTKAGGYKTPLRDLFSDYLARKYGTKAGAADVERYINALSDSDMQIYWPYSEDWDGKSFPIVTFDPGFGAESNYGYEIRIDKGGAHVVDSVLVTEQVAMERPVWVINRNDDAAFTPLELFNKAQAAKNDDKKDSGDKDLAQPPPGEEEKEKDEPKEDETESKEEEKEVDKDVESVLRKAKERTEEYEAEKKARMRKARLPPNERDW